MRYVIESMLSAVLTVWIAVTLAFITLAILPGDAIESQLTQSGIAEEIIVERRGQLGLSDPLAIKYLRFLTNAVQGDLGISLLSGENVTRIIGRSIGPTLSLALSALIAACVLGIALGIASALGKGAAAWIGKLVTNLALSLPIYWTGTIAIFVFTVQLGLLPSAGAGRVSQLVLPVAVLAFHTSAPIARVVSAQIREVYQAAYIRAARAKGLSEMYLVTVHVLRAALLPVIALISLQAGFLMSGTVITESLFVRPGIGRVLLDATIRQDYPVVLGVVVMAALIYTGLNLIADVIYRLLDPRVSF